MDKLAIIAGWYGAKHQSGSSTNTDSIAFIETTAETVFVAIKENGNNTDVSDDYLKGSLTVPAGTKIRPVNDGYFSSIEISSGSYSYVLKGSE